MKLYSAPFAPNPRRVRVFIAEKGLEIDTVDVDLGKLEHKSEAFAAVNPLRQVPVLELDDGTRISESVAICRYIEELHPEPNLFGGDGLERAIIEMWQRRMELDLMLVVAQVFRHSHPAMTELERPQVAEWSEANRPRALAALKWLDGELGGRPYIAGERFTIADITGLVAIDFLKPARLAVPDDHRNLRRWHETVSARPSARA